MALRLLSRVRGTLPQGRSLPDEVWWGRHRAILLILWLHVPTLMALAVLFGDGLDEASGVVVVAAS
ncbi:MAG TPA: GGDEF-domain containing protein, partial [Actinomycetes bacterium]|nr:GGDEF-domain containing protein [Actinomycetes bacterium]